MDKADAKKLIASLTPRHRDVLELMCIGLNARRIAEDLGIGEQTVANHKNRIFKRLGVHSSTAAVAVAFAARSGLRQ